MSSAPLTDWIDAVPLAQLQAEGVKVVHVASRPVAVFWHQDRVHAVDNRCPHMGFPLHRGTVKDGILTCHWHQARFDLCSGCTFDLFADDVPSFESRVENGHVWVRSTPRRVPDTAFYLERFRGGLEHNIGLIQAKSLMGLLADHPSETARDIVRVAVLFGAQRRDDWTSGLTMLTLVAALDPHMSDTTRYYALFRASQTLARESANVAPRRARPALDTTEHSLATLSRWMNHWIRSRQRDGAERVLQTAIATAATSTQLTDLLLSAETQRIYAAGGHNYDAINTAIELLDLIGHEHTADVLPLVVPPVASSRGAEEQAHWHHPVEIVEPLFRAVSEIPQRQRAGTGKTWRGDDALVPLLLGEEPLQTLAALSDALAQGAAPDQLARLVAYAAALRLARFAASNDVNDWFGPQHTFIYANAVHQAVLRAPTPGVSAGIFHGAMEVYMDRFLNVPPAKLPGERGNLDDLPTTAPALREQFLTTLDRLGQLETAGRIAARWLRLRLPHRELIDTLAYATVREDLDFHTLQVLAAGVRQAQSWGFDTPQAEHIFVGVARHLAAFCPTRRSSLQTADIARRLHRGEKLFEEES